MRQKMYKKYTIYVKRIYDKSDDDDSYRLLVDRLWPRGISKEQANISLWIKEIAPSDDLRRRFHKDPTKWLDFRDEYIKELDAKQDQIEKVLELIKTNDKTTLLYASKDRIYNNANILSDYLKMRLK
jgi:uncharacterized protein YeaO (DUF488 family)